MVQLCNKRFDFGFSVNSLSFTNKLQIRCEAGSLINHLPVKLRSLLGNLVVFFQGDVVAHAYGCPLFCACVENANDGVIPIKGSEQLSRGFFSRCVPKHACDG